MCHARVAYAIPAMTRMKLISDRSTMIFRPKRSDTRPHAGARRAVIAGVTPRLNPDHIATSPTSCTPSCCR
jgi:hypothetical protein